MNDRQLFEQIDRILWEEWDPIGINKSGSHDEYRGYVPSIMNVLRKNADLSQITNLLNHHATLNMGFSSNVEHHEKVAK